MRFVDAIELSLTAGNGGNGCMSFRRERFLPFGGPDGGNGGNGGSVILCATKNLQTLSDFERCRRFKGSNGGHGEGNNRNGRYAADTVLQVPCGTLVYDAETGEGLADLVEPGDKFVAASGGRGGRGNRVFASSANKIPRFSEKGKPGESVRLRLELKLIADIGFVGLPNAGKSSLLAALSNAQPKIASYPFTTLSPNLGVLFVEDEAIVLADIPGLIEGASQNKGLGLSFLRHIERTRLLLHVLDLSSGDITTILKNWDTVLEEMKAYDTSLTQRPLIVIGNKIDLLVDDATRNELISELHDYFSHLSLEFFPISAFTGENTESLMDNLLAFSQKYPRPKGKTRLFAIHTEEEKGAVNQKRRRYKVEIITQQDGTFRVLHPQIEDAAIRFDFSQDENINRFRRLLLKYRVEELLNAAGAESGDTICIGKTEFVYYPDYFAMDSNDNSNDSEKNHL